MSEKCRKIVMSDVGKFSDVEKRRKMSKNVEKVSTMSKIVGKLLKLVHKYWESALLFSSCCLLFLETPRQPMNSKVVVPWVLNDRRRKQGTK